MSRSVFQLLRLPNELLILIAELLGPPDFSHCDPGWLVLPAVCRRLRAVAERSVDLSAGEFSGDIFANGEECSVFWDSSFPVYNGSSIEFRNWYLRLAAEGPNGWKALDRQVGSPLILRRPHRLNTTWIKTLSLGCQAWKADSSLAHLSFEDAPRFVAPALKRLDLTNYIVDWRCDGLEELSIRMHSWPTMGYRYPVARLFERLAKSRQTLQSVELSHCLLTRPQVVAQERAIPTTLAFPNLSQFELTTASNEAAYFVQRMSFPAGCLPAFNVHGSALGFLSCFSWVGSDDKTRVNVLTVREAARGSGYGCTVTGSRISTKDDSALRSYAAERVPRLDRYGYGKEIRRLDQSTPALEPLFIANLDWNVNAWKLFGPSSLYNIQGVQYIFINGKKGRLFKSDTADSEIWTTLLRHLPNVHALYRFSPSLGRHPPLGRMPRLAQYRIKTRRTFCIWRV
ncbi:unnamed protein product [Peniophora sp. CBMAI 1063]|nr:unnamed protein product [Peniophora sp. CBMAI 1063]